MDALPVGFGHVSCHSRAVVAKVFLVVAGAACLGGILPDFPTADAMRRMGLGQEVGDGEMVMLGVANLASFAATYYVIRKISEHQDRRYDVLLSPEMAPVGEPGTAFPRPALGATTVHIGPGEPATGRALS